MSEIDDYLSAHAYRASEGDPIQAAVWRLAFVLDARDRVREGRRLDPASFPAVWPDTSVEAAALKVVGFMLDLGWTPPAANEVAAALELAARRPSADSGEAAS